MKTTNVYVCWTLRQCLTVVLLLSAGAKLEGRDRLQVPQIQEAVVAPDEVDDEDLGQTRLDLHLRERGRWS